MEAVLSLTVLALMCGQCSLSAIYRFGDTHPELQSGLGLRRSPSLATLSGLLRMVKVAGMRQAMLSFMVALPQTRGPQTTVAAMDGKTMCGMWQEGEQLRLWHVFSREGSLALDQVQISGYLEEPRAAQEWMEQVSGSVGGLRVLAGDSLYAEADLCQAILEQGKDYLLKLKNRLRLYQERNQDVELLFAETGEASLTVVNKGMDVWNTKAGMGIGGVGRIHTISQACQRDDGAPGDIASGPGAAQRERSVRGE